MALSITQASHSSTMVIATFWSIHFAFVTWLLSSHDHAHIIPATITRIKHTTRTKETTIWDKAPIILGKALVGSVSPLFHFLIGIQSQIIGKHVFNFIPFSQPCPHLLFVSSCAATTYHHKKLNPTNNDKKTQTKYHNLFLFINIKV